MSTVILESPDADGVLKINQRSSIWARVQSATISLRGLHGEFCLADSRLFGNLSCATR